MNKLIFKIDQIQAAAEEEIARALPEEVEKIKVKYLGRKSQLAGIMHIIGDLKNEEKKTVGARANQAYQEIESWLLKKKTTARDKETKKTDIDLTAPGRLYERGHLHPVTQVIDELLDTFTALGYEIVDGNEIEDEQHNFELLNMPPEHPARDMQDTFYLKSGNLPRTHTSPVQIRYMESHRPPVKIVSPGKAYRNENEDASHSWVFHQIEGLVIDEDISFADLKGTLEVVVRTIFGSKTKTRFRASFFPYTEPSAEMDASCPQCDGKGCRSCGYSGWIELLGAGMVAPKVLKNMGLDNQKYSGFAFGLGPERVAAIKYQIPDVRFFWHPNINFLEQF